MCGIAGVLRFDGKPVPRDQIAAMTRTLAHRGPDGEGVWADGSIGLGHRRLAILDLSERGAQPMSFGNFQVMLTFNGEIYNYRQLRAELVRDFGFEFASDTDSEVILAAYVAWGDAFVERLHGMFAFGLWDGRNRRLLLARDAAGIKPLFVLRTPQFVAFASEVKALMPVPGWQPQLDPSAVHAYFAQGYVSPERTLLSDIDQVAPGSVRVVTQSGAVADHRFWRADRKPDITTLNDAVEAFSGLWREVVADHLISDVPVGILQSGGIDSSLIAAATAGRDLPLFTAAFKSRSHDKSPVAAAIAQVLGAEHHTTAVDAEADVEQRYRRMVWHTDGQIYDSSGLALHAIAEVVRRNVKVVLSGEGGDEFFGGYSTYRASVIASRIAPLLPRALLTKIGVTSLRHTGAGEGRLPLLEIVARFCLGAAAAPGTAHAHWRRLMPAHMIPDLYGPRLQPLAATDPLKDYAAQLAPPPDPLVDRCLQADQRHYLPGCLLMKADAMTMAHGLELRVPFLDRRIMDLAGRIDARVLVPFRGPNKQVLRAALDRTPLAFVAKAKKRGFNIPVARLLRTQLRPLGERLLDRNADRWAGLLNPHHLRAVWQQHQQRVENHGHMLWCLLTLTTWLDQLETQQGVKIAA